MGVTSQVGYNGSRIAVSLYALELGANQFTIGVLVALYAVFPVLLAILVGKFVDRVGPKLPVIIGVAGTGVALLLPPLFPGITVLYVSCIALGLTHLLFTLPIEASIGGIGGAEKRAANYALLSMGWSVANFFGPVIAGFSIDHVGQVQVFWVLASFYVLPMLILLFKPGLLPRTAMHAGRDKHGSVIELWRMPNLRTVFITGTVIHSAQHLFQFYFPIYGHSLGISASAIGSILGVLAAAAFVIRSTIPFLMKRRTEAEILTYAVFSAAFAFVLFPFVANPYALAAIAFLLGLAVGCSNPLSMSLLYVLTPPSRVAESVGLLHTAYNFTHLVIPVVFGSVGAAFGFSTVFLSNAAMLVAGGLLIRKTRLPIADLRPK
ncbi:MAG: MFS transporter [Betaproteobacteria bacterium]|nr:MFS transporter [Betaproteobacteria bacterium]